jgi:hypothetical protein
MQYNSNATSQDLVSLANALTKRDNTKFPLTEKTLYANMGNRIILTEIHNSYGGWKYDDRNNTDFPIATTNLVSAQSNYGLPTDTTQINGVYVKYSGDVWDKLDPITLEQINRQEAEPEFESTDGVPRYYRTLSNSIVVYPASNLSVTDGLMIEYSRDISSFATTDTTKTPGFDPIFHESLGVYMAYQYAQINSLDNLKDLKEQWFDSLARIKRHYAQKFKDMYPARVKMYNNVNDYL